MGAQRILSVTAAGLLLVVSVKVEAQISPSNVRESALGVTQLSEPPFSLAPKVRSPVDTHATTAEAWAVSGMQRKQLYVAVIGHVRQPGVYGLHPGQLNLEAVIHSCQGLKSTASGNVRIIRGGRPGGQLFIDQSHRGIDFTVLANDVLIVEGHPVGRSNTSKLVEGDRVSLSDNSLVHIAIVNLIDRPVVLPVWERRATGRKLLETLGQPNGLSESMKLIPTTDGLRQRLQTRLVDADRPLLSGDAIVLPQGLSNPGRIPVRLPQPTMSDAPRGFRNDEAGAVRTVSHQKIILQAATRVSGATKPVPPDQDSSAAVSPRESSAPTPASDDGTAGLPVPVPFEFGSGAIRPSAPRSFIALPAEEIVSETKSREPLEFGSKHQTSSNRPSWTPSNVGGQAAVIPVPETISRGSIPRERFNDAAGSKFGVIGEDGSAESGSPTGKRSSRALSWEENVAFAIGYVGLIILGFGAMCVWRMMLTGESDERESEPAEKHEDSIDSLLHNRLKVVHVPVALDPQIEVQGSRPHSVPRRIDSAETASGPHRRVPDELPSTGAPQAGESRVLRPYSGNKTGSLETESVFLQPGSVEPALQDSQVWVQRPENTMSGSGIEALGSSWRPDSSDSLNEQQAIGDSPSDVSSANPVGDQSGISTGRPDHRALPDDGGSTTSLPSETAAQAAPSQGDLLDRILQRVKGV